MFSTMITEKNVNEQSDTATCISTSSESHTADSPWPNRGQWQLSMGGDLQIHCFIVSCLKKMTTSLLLVFCV